jgi:hypothetical protein
MRRHTALPFQLNGNIMTVCPIAIVAGCQKCPAFKICPLKGVLGDKPAAAAEPKPAAKAPAKSRKPAASRKK